MRKHTEGLHTLHFRVCCSRTARWWPRWRPRWSFGTRSRPTFPAARPSTRTMSCCRTCRWRTSSIARRRRGSCTRCGGVLSMSLCLRPFPDCPTLLHVSLPAAGARLRPRGRGSIPVFGRSRCSTHFLKLTRSIMLSCLPLAHISDRSAAGSLPAPGTDPVFLPLS